MYFFVYDICIKSCKKTVKSVKSVKFNKKSHYSLRSLFKVNTLWKTDLVVGLLHRR